MFRPLDWQTEIYPTAQKDMKKSLMQNLIFYAVSKS